MPRDDTAKSSIVHLSTPPRSDGLSSIRIVTRIGYWYETHENCGGTHLAEYILGRKVWEYLPAQGFSGARINGYTGPDRMILSLDIPGGKAGLLVGMAAVARALESSRETKPTPREIELLQAENALTATAKSPVPLVLGAFRDNDRAIAKGTCAAQNLERAVADFWQRAAVADREMIVASAVSDDDVRSAAAATGITALMRVEGSPPERPLDLLTGALENGGANAAGFFIRGDDPIGAIAFWEIVARELASSYPGERAQPEFTPVGTIGFQIRFPNADPVHIAKSVEATRQKLGGQAKSDDDLAQAFRQARATFCQPLNLARNPVFVADQAGIDPWADPMPIHAHACEDQGDVNAGDLLLRARNGGRRILPLSSAAASISNPRALADTVTVSLCKAASSPTRLSKLDVFSLHALLLYRLRFQESVALNVVVRPPSNGDGCAQFGIVAPIVPVETLLAIIRANPKPTGALDAELGHARTVACIEAGMVEERAGIGSSARCDDLEVAASLQRFLPDILAGAR